MHIDFHQVHEEEYLTEFRELALSAGATPLAIIKGMRSAPDPKYFVGSGKAQEIAQSVKETGARLVLFNHVLSPAQKRNLEQLFQNCSVLDRTELILDIFGQRARTFEGKLQVELAQLQYLSTRLVHGWTHLERQKGGIGLRGGPGETQLEVDRRLLRHRIKLIKERLEKVRKQRQLSRRARRRTEIPTVSLIGYTNAGKSTLFHALTEAKVFIANQLFATLDPTLRRIDLPEIGPVVVADTVGFIRDLPHDLVDAFRATLEETRLADLLIHVVDAHHTERQLFMEEVDHVLTQIGADQVPQLQVYNKVDLSPETSPHLDRDADGQPTRVWLSALTGEGLPLLKQALVEKLSQAWVNQKIRLLPEEGKLRAALYAAHAVVSEQQAPDGSSTLFIRLSRSSYEKLLGRRDLDTTEE